MVSCDPKSGYQKDRWLTMFKPHPKNMVTIINSIVNIIEGDLCDHLMSTRIFIVIKD